MAALEKKSGVASRSMYKWDENVPAVDKVVSVAACLGVSIDYLMGVTDNPDRADAAFPLAAQYELLDSYGRELVDSVLAVELRRVEKAKADAKKVKAMEEKLAKREAELPPRVKRIPFIRDVAAGSGIPADVCWEQYEVPADSPADFAVKVNGDSMEPYFPDGEIFLGVKRMPQNCEIAFVLLDGEQYIKLYGMDTQGTLYLFSLNRERRDYVIKKDDARRVEIWGTIITDRKFTQPLDGPNDEDKPHKKRKH